MAVWLIQESDDSLNADATNCPDTVCIYMCVCVYIYIYVCVCDWVWDLSIHKLLNYKLTQYSSHVFLRPCDLTM